LQVEEFKKEVIIILGSEIKFDGHIEKVIENVDIERKQSILQWVKDYKQGTVRPEPCKRLINQISFIYKSNDNKIRGILAKEKNSYFIELFLDNHKYYDRKRRYLGL